MKRVYIITVLSSLVLILLFGGAAYLKAQNGDDNRVIKVGILYPGDESTPYTANFIKAQRNLEAEWGDELEVLVRENVAEGTEEEYLRELADAGCDLIFSTSYGYRETVKQMAGEYPSVTFCQSNGGNANEEPLYDNYHTFMGYIEEGRYTAGVAAGMKLQSLIDDGTISEKQAKIGYVGAYPNEEVISGYRAFLAGVRSVVPEAKMYVRYTDSWGSYSLEKKAAKQLIEEGCVVISQHSDTIGPAAACEEAAAERVVYHVGYNQSMESVAPTSSLISSGIDWEPYMAAAVQAVYDGEPIEKEVDADIDGNDAKAGFDKGWVRMFDLNSSIAAPGTQEAIDETVEQFKKDDIEVFQGDDTENIIVEE
jgi:basic membrane protein A